MEIRARGASLTTRGASLTTRGASLTTRGASLTTRGASLTTRGASLTENDGQAFYVLLRGECDVSHTAASGEEQTHPRMHEGDVFGEIALLQSGPTTATVRAVGRCVVLALQREWFDELLLRDPSARTRIYALAAERLDRTSAAAARMELDHGLV